METAFGSGCAGVVGVVVGVVEVGVVDVGVVDDVVPVVVLATVVELDFFDDPTDFPAFDAVEAVDGAVALFGALVLPFGACTLAFGACVVTFGALAVTFGPEAAAAETLAIENAATVAIVRNVFIRFPPGALFHKTGAGRRVRGRLVFSAS